MAKETESRAVAATAQARKQEAAAKVAKRRLAATDYDAALYYGERREHRRAILAMRRAVDHLEDLDAESEREAYRKKLIELLGKSPLYHPPESLPTGGNAIAFRHDVLQPGRRLAVLAAKPTQREHSARAFSPWTEGTYLYVVSAMGGTPAESRGAPVDEGKKRQGISLFVDMEWSDWGLDEEALLEYWRGNVGLRYYPSPYVGIGFYVPYSWAIVYDGDFESLEWENAASSVRMSVLVQF
jgi:hypothetical protein